MSLQNNSIFWKFSYRKQYFALQVVISSKASVNNKQNRCQLTVQVDVWTNSWCLIGRWHVEWRFFTLILSLFYWPKIILADITGDERSDLLEHFCRILPTCATDEIFICQIQNRESRCVKAKRVFRSQLAQFWCKFKHFFQFARVSKTFSVQLFSKSRQSDTQ